MLIVAVIREDPFLAASLSLSLPPNSIYILRVACLRVLKLIYFAISECTLLIAVRVSTSTATSDHVSERKIFTTLIRIICTMVHAQK